MAIVTISGSTSPIARGVLRTAWTFLAASTSGSITTPLVAPQYPDKTVHIRGPWVSGVTLLIQGSNTATYSTGLAAWATLSTPCGAALEGLVTGKSRTILQNPKYIRARLTTRTGTLGAPTVEIISQSTKR